MESPSYFEIVEFFRRRERRQLSRYVQANNSKITELDSIKSGK